MLLPTQVQSLSTSATSRPFQLQHIDHIVLTFQGDSKPMMNFYTDILGCTIDSPEDVGRMNGRLTHLRAGPHTMIDLLKREEEESPTPSSSVDHFCLRIDPYDAKELEEYLQSRGIEIVIPNGMRKGAEGVGPSIYIEDPEGNTIELKGPTPKPANDGRE